VSGDGTRVVHAGLPAASDGSPLGPGPVLASTYHLSGEPSGGYQYGRYSNPTWTALEQALGELEGGQATVFASGMAAVSAVLLSVLRPGDVLVLPSDGYYTVRDLADGLLTELGVQVRALSTPGQVPPDALAGARLLWLETPSNPALDVWDIAQLSAAASAAGALVAVDNTACTPLGQQPLALGADLSVGSDTKALTGHSDLVLGHVAVHDPELADDLRRWRRITGAVPGPFEAWLAHRSLATLDLRLERQARNALAVADLLAAHPLVSDVRHPWRPADPAFALTARQTRRGAGLVCFTLPDADAAQRFLSAAQLVAEATSFGGVHSSAERRARWGGDALPAGFVRLSLGCEDTADLLADLAQALGAADGGSPPLQ
jgi:cystathionine gamma-lyase